jgi:excinuclease ABC subunit A
MHFLPDVFVSCEACRGRRFRPEVLTVEWRGRSIADVLAMTVDEASRLLEGEPAAARALRVLRSVGLGYLALGQPATTLSGGEAQRLKIARELAVTATWPTLYLLDEPTVGLHMSDVQRLLDVLERLIERGHTVVCVEHNLDVIRNADWIVDLGPGGGDAGGRLVAEGTPDAVMQVAESWTGKFLAGEAV